MVTRSPLEFSAPSDRCWGLGLTDRGVSGAETEADPKATLVSHTHRSAPQRCLD
jgi:hypothetical protein